MSARMRRAIVERVDASHAEQTALLAELVKVPSDNPPGDCAPHAEAAAGLLRRLGFDVETHPVPAAEARGNGMVSVTNLIVRQRFGAGPTVALNAHGDVVPPGQGWTADPYGAAIEAGWMYGRGAGDMKAGIAANLFALEALRRIGYRPAADVHLQSVIEEECTGNGALACLQRGYRADAFLVTEPFGDRLVRAQIGVMWLRITVRGRPVHVLDTAGGANAIEAAFPLIQALHGLEERWNAPARKHAAFAEVEHPINVNVGTIQGGDWPSSVPAWCTFEMRIAVYPDQDLEEAREEVERCIRTAAQDNPFLADFPPKIEYPGFLSEGYVLQGADEAIGILERAHRAAYGSALEQTVTTAMTDARFTGLYAGIPSLVYGPTAENIHGFNERVELESVRKITQAIALFVAEWCGLEAA